nr:type II toxin-antitoxin system YoeB family toxin [uncultured Mucilaginibacter sp.]
MQGERKLYRAVFEKGDGDKIGVFFTSRRINLEHRIVYKIDIDTIVILQCRYHY